jgi:hypothetical protein
MTYPMLLHIPLKSAYLCQDCNSIGNSAVQCPACASSVLMSLSNVLDREVPADGLALTFSFPLPVAAARLPVESVEPELAEMVA